MKIVYENFTVENFIMHNYQLASLHVSEDNMLLKRGRVNNSS